MSDTEEEEVDNRPRPLPDFPPRRQYISDSQVRDRVAGLPRYFFHEQKEADKATRNAFSQTYYNRADDYHLRPPQFRKRRNEILLLSRLLRENRNHDNPRQFISELESYSSALSRDLERRLYDRIPELPIMDESGDHEYYEFFHARDLRALLRHEHMRTRHALYRQATRRFDNYNPFRLG